MGRNSRRRAFLVKQLIFIALFIVGITAGLRAIAKHYSALPSAEIQFDNDGVISDKFSVQVAATGATRQKGLMFVPKAELEGNRGMMFIFPEEIDHPFWMKNTPASLDMIFVNKDRNVVGVIHNTQPFSEERRSIGMPSTYVVELLAGTANALKIEKGSKLLVLDDLPSAQ